MSDHRARTSVPTWVRIGLVALGVPQAVTGLWAVLAPESWYESFPGWDPRLVAAEPPFNEHLASDTGAGILAAGVVLLIGAWLADTRSVRLALAAFAVFAVPHAAFHAANPSDLLTSAEDAQNVTVLVFTVVAAAALALGTRARQRGAARSTNMEATPA